MRNRTSFRVQFLSGDIDVIVKKTYHRTLIKLSSSLLLLCAEKPVSAQRVKGLGRRLQRYNESIVDLLKLIATKFSYRRKRKSRKNVSSGIESLLSNELRCRTFHWSEAIFFSIFFASIKWLLS